MIDLDEIKAFLKLITETGFLLFFAIYSLINHNKALKRLIEAVDNLSAMIRTLKD